MMSLEKLRLNSGAFSRVNLVRERSTGALRVCKAAELLELAFLRPRYHPVGPKVIEFVSKLV